MLLWISIALLLDAGCVLWFEPLIARAMPRMNVRWIAIGEAGLAVLLAIIHFNWPS